MKWLIRLLIVFVVAIIFSLLTQITDITFSTGFFNTLFTVIGVMFSISMSLVMSFTLSDISNINFVSLQRGKIKNIQKIFVILFIIASLIFIFSSKEITFSIKLFTFSFCCLYASSYLFIIGYFIINFLSLFDLKNEIEDKIREAKKE